MMGRSAKLYKKKPKSKLKQHQQPYDRIEAEEAVAAKKDVLHARLRGKQDALKETPGATDRPVQKNRLKSKVWQQLDAQRAKSGMAEYATPKQAGIDYMSQWGRKKAGV